jgi:hypothetical protein
VLATVCGEESTLDVKTCKPIAPGVVSGFVSEAVIKRSEPGLAPTSPALHLSQTKGRYFMSDTQASGNSAAYHDHPALSSTQVSAYLNDPIEWYHQYVAKDWPRKEPTVAMNFGTTVHQMAETTLPAMIRTGGWESFIKVIPRDVLNADGHCKGSAWTSWKADNPSEFYVKEGEPNPFITIWDHLMANSWCRELIANGQKEVEHYWHDDVLGDCRVKLDVSSDAILADWKTTHAPNPHKFRNEIVARHYDVRLSLYRRGFIDLYGFEPEIYVVAINTKGGFKVTPYRLPESWLDDAGARLVFAVDEMRHFDLAKYLDAAPVTLEQPRYSILDLESGNE